MSTRPSSARLFQIAERNIFAGESDDPADQARQISRGEATEIINGAINEFLVQYGEFLSHYKLKGSFGFWRTVETWQQEHDMGTKELEEILSCGATRELAEVFTLSLETAIVQLVEEQPSPLKRLQLQEWNDDAKADFATMRRHVRASAQGTRRAPSGEVISAADTIPAAPELSPEERCAADFHSNMGMQAWKAKWLVNDQLHAVADRAAERGLL